MRDGAVLDWRCGACRGDADRRIRVPPPSREDPGTLGGFRHPALQQGQGRYLNPSPTRVATNRGRGRSSIRGCQPPIPSRDIRLRRKIPYPAEAVRPARRILALPIVRACRSGGAGSITLPYPTKGLCIPRALARHFDLDPIRCE